MEEPLCMDPWEGWRHGAYGSASEADSSCGGSDAADFLNSSRRYMVVADAAKYSSHCEGALAAQEVGGQEDDAASRGSSTNPGIYDGDGREASTQCSSVETSNRSDDERVVPCGEVLAQGLGSRGCAAAAASSKGPRSGLRRHTGGLLPGGDQAADEGASRCAASAGRSARPAEASLGGLSRTNRSASALAKASAVRWAKSAKAAAVVAGGRASAASPTRPARSDKELPYNRSQEVQALQAEVLMQEVELRRLLTARPGEDVSDEVAFQAANLWQGLERIRGVIDDLSEQVCDSRPDTGALSAHMPGSLPEDLEAPALRKASSGCMPSASSSSSSKALARLRSQRLSSPCKAKAAVAACESSMCSSHPSQSSQSMLGTRAKTGAGPGRSPSRMRTEQQGAYPGLVRGTGRGGGAGVRVSPAPGLPARRRSATPLKASPAASCSHREMAAAAPAAAAEPAAVPSAAAGSVAEAAAAPSAWPAPGLAAQRSAVPDGVLSGGGALDASSAEGPAASAADAAAAASAPASELRLLSRSLSPPPQRVCLERGGLRLSSGTMFSPAAVLQPASSSRVDCQGAAPLSGQVTAIHRHFVAVAAAAPSRGISSTSFVPSTSMASPIVFASGVPTVLHSSSRCAAMSSG
eukprot:TRINITY_DN52187_c0_g1_i1.p1 TRINITY_DN52187_c0_g1~~TRINITY_DN52187_c0_g1_i1.p1  ORF type:complete len:639 (-),score=149.01 TRINITY_DN52187_c0_g1_i1:51-1967(-)